MSLWDLLRRLLRRPPTRKRATTGRAPSRAATTFDARTTWEVTDPKARPVQLVYAPKRNGAPDAGEIVWAWVPFHEDPTQGKDRPLLVIARHDAQRVYAVKLTSKPSAGRRDHLSIGTGAWDRSGRESWVDLDQLYSVHVHGIRREAAPLTREVFTHVARALVRRHGWRFES